MFEVERVRQRQGGSAGRAGSPALSSRIVEQRWPFNPVSRGGNFFLVSGLGIYLAPIFAPRWAWSSSREGW